MNPTKEEVINAISDFLDKRNYRNEDFIEHILNVSRIQRFRRFVKLQYNEDNNKVTLSFYCRTGGGNREEYPNTELKEHKYLVSDEDDIVDSTYNDYVFEIPFDEFIESYSDFLMKLTINRNIFNK